MDWHTRKIRGNVLRSMKIGTMANYYFVSKVESHKKLKGYLLKTWSEIGSVSVKSNSEQIINTDYEIANQPRLWTDLFMRKIQPNLLEVQHGLLADDFFFDKIWFQQYIKNDYHGWHVHANTNYSAIYFTECPSGMETEFFDVTKKKEFEVQLEEGDLIVFPGQIYHRSKPNFTDQRKSVVSFNLSFINNNEQKILDSLQ